MRKQNKTDWNAFHDKIRQAKESLKPRQTSKDEILEILRQRAQSIASETENKDDVKESISLLEFELGQEKYAIQTHQLKEIQHADQIVDLPCTPSFVFGMMNIRGKIISVLNLKKYLNLEYVGFNDYASIIIVEYQGEWVGIVADKISGIRDIPLDRIQKSKPGLVKIKDDYIFGITDETTIILKTDKILADDRIMVNEILN